MAGSVTSGSRGARVNGAHDKVRSDGELLQKELIDEAEKDRYAREDVMYTNFAPAKVAKTSDLAQGPREEIQLRDMKENLLKDLEVFLGRECISVHG